MSRWGVLCVLLIAGTLCGQTPSTVDFRRDVQPIFRTYCYECHGPSQQMNGFRLDRRRDAMKGGTIVVIGPGNAAGSRLYHKLIGSQYGPQMPPTGALKPEQIETIRRWIDQGAEWPDDLAGEPLATVPHPQAARLMQALRDGDHAAFHQMLAADPTAAGLKGPGGSTPLMYAALYGDAAAVRLLLDRGADPNARNDAGATALMWAVDDIQKARLLVERGAQVNARSADGRTALMIAARIHGSREVLQLLLDHGADLSVTAPALVGETSPLIEALLAGNEPAFRLLLEHGANWKAAGPGALALAMRANCGSCMQTFLNDAGPDLLTPAMFAVSPPRGPALGILPLLEHGAVATARSPEGDQILALAAASDAFPVEVVQALLKRGADVNSKNAQGDSALELASRHGRTPVVDLLLRSGARDVTETPRAVPPKPAASLREAVSRVLPRLQQNDAAFLRKSGCVSCHNNTLTAVTIASARKSGFRVDEAEVRQQLKIIGAYVESWRERALQNIGIPGNTDTVGYILLGLAAANYPPDAATDALARFVKAEQVPDGHWRLLADRPPIESSEVEVTAVALRALQAYGPKARRGEYQEAITRAARWLAEAQPRQTEDRVFQLLGLTWSGGHPETVRQAAAALLSHQRPDGGWSQIPTRESDAYATGQALVALQESGALRASDPAAKRAIAFLMSTQAEDGTWPVRRRAFPLQPYFDSGFPYGRDQFISCAGTNWAATALALAAR